METFGLNFGCFDFAITKTGEPVFLECNPNGQWLWVQNLTGMPIGKAIAEEFMPAPSMRPLNGSDLIELSDSLSREDFRQFSKNFTITASNGTMHRSDTCKEQNAIS